MLAPVLAGPRDFGSALAQQQLRQLGDIHRNPSRLVFREQLGADRRSG
jgi:hypothetical protein